MAREQGKRASRKAGVTLSHISPKLLIKTVSLISGYEEIHRHQSKHKYTDLQRQIFSQAHEQSHWLELAHSDSHSSQAWLQNLVQSVAHSDSTDTFQESKSETERRADRAKCSKEKLRRH